MTGLMRWGTRGVATRRLTCCGENSGLEVNRAHQTYNALNATYAVADELEAGSSEKFYEFGVELFVGVPWSTRHLSGWFEVEQHIDFSGRMLECAVKTTYAA